MPKCSLSAVICRGDSVLMRISAIGSKCRGFVVTTSNPFVQLDEGSTVVDNKGFATTLVWPVRGGEWRL
jgi:hypothetical protein